MKYYLIAGEASGERHGAALAERLRACDPESVIRFRRGGRTGAVMGFTDVLLRAPALLREFRSCLADIRTERPDALILIDYPGFNLRVARWAHKAGYKVFWYIAPKLWASREGRIRSLRKYVDKLFVIFPFEEEYFRRKGMDAVYVGNPLVEEVEDDGGVSFRAERRNLALLPGSRDAEIRSMMPTLMRLAARLHAMPEYADYQFVIAAAPGRTRADYALGGNDAFVQVVCDDAAGVLRSACAAVVNSGTASLEAALCDTPQVVVYKTDALSAWLIRRFIKVPYVSLVNLILGRRACTEL